MKRRLRWLFLYLLAFCARRSLRWPSSTISRVLYVKPDHLGDLLLATPVLSALRQRLPSAHITALVGPWSQFVLQQNPDIDTLLICPFPGFARHPPTTGRSWWQRARDLLVPYISLLRYVQLLRIQRYDLAIIGRDDHWWGAALAMLAGVPHRIGFAVPECRPFLSIALAWDPHAHVTVQGLDLVQAITAPTAQPMPTTSFPTRFDPTSVEMDWAAKWLQLHVPSQQRLVIIHPGTGGPTKLWLPSRWALVVDTLARTGAGVVITGGPDEQALVAEIAAQARQPILTLAGQTSVGQLAALLRHATLVLGVDSGPLHLAAAQGVTTLHLYGPGDDARFGPWGDPAQHVVMRADLWCSPCGEFNTCPRGLAQPECMERITAASVITRVQQIYAQACNQR